MSSNSDDGFFAKIGRQLKDLTFVEVITATGDPRAFIDVEKDKIVSAVEDAKLDILARTVIELDGDILMILPKDPNTTNVEIHKEILEIHKDNVTIAVQNWNAFINTILQVAGAIAQLAGLSKENIFDKLKIDIRSPT